MTTNLSALCGARVSVYCSSVDLRPSRDAWRERASRTKEKHLSLLVDLCTNRFEDAWSSEERACAGAVVRRIRTCVVADQVAAWSAPPSGKIDLSWLVIASQLLTV
ncbi:hypothetical protein GCM10020219_020580 [Nonomuraea dietziae]